VRRENAVPYREVARTLSLAEPLTGIGATRMKPPGTKYTSRMCMLACVPIADSVRYMR